MSLPSDAVVSLTCFTPLRDIIFSAALLTYSPSSLRTTLFKQVSWSRKQTGKDARRLMVSMLWLPCYAPNAMPSMLWLPCYAPNAMPSMLWLPCYAPNAMPSMLCHPCYAPNAMPPSLISYFKALLLNGVNQYAQISNMYYSVT